MKTESTATIEDDELYRQAVNLVRDTGRASTSQVQRYFRIGYNRAARIMESMESAGVISEMDSSGKRVVLSASREGR